MAVSTLLSRGERSVEPSDLLVLAREVEGTSKVDVFLAIERKGKQKIKKQWRNRRNLEKKSLKKSAAMEKVNRNNKFQYLLKGVKREELTAPHTRVWAIKSAIISNLWNQKGGRSKIQNSNPH
jgi:hypothetical protein